MRFVIGCLVLGLLAPLDSEAQSLDTQHNVWEANIQQYVSEVDLLRKSLNIPGLALSIIEDGHVLYTGGLGEQRNGASFTAQTPLRIASVTKSFSAVLVMQAVEKGELSLSDPVHAYISDFTGPQEVTVYHLLTHTSEGNPGEEYVYGTNRYALLSTVLEKATSQSFERLLRDRILTPSGMKWYASPYLGAHAGLVSTVEDMSKYASALDGEHLLPGQVQTEMAEPLHSTKGDVLPIGLGWLAQEIQGVSVAWSFGQDDPDHSGALFLRIPDKKRTLIILANANYLSDAFRLMMGDATKSPFAMSFMRLFAFSDPGEPLPGIPEQYTDKFSSFDLSAPALKGYSFEDELIGKYLVALWTQNKSDLDFWWNAWVEQYPEKAQEPDIAMLFPLLMIDDEPYNTAGLEMAKQLLKEHPRNRWVLLPAAYLYEQNGQDMDAIPLYEKILDLPNQEPDFLHRLFNAWALTGLANYWKDKDVEKAIGYLNKAMNLNVGGGTQAQVKALLDELETRP